MLITLLFVANLLNYRVANSESTTLNLDNQEKMSMSSHGSVNYIKANSDVYKLVNSNVQLNEAISRNDPSVPTVENKIPNSSDVCTNVCHTIVSDVSTPLPNISPSQMTSTFASSEPHDMLVPNRDQRIRDMINIQERNQILMSNNNPIKTSRNQQRPHLGQNSSLHSSQFTQQSENYVEQIDLQRENRNNVYSKFASNLTFENENILNDDNPQGLVNAVGGNNMHLNSHWNPDCESNFEGIDTKSQLWKKRNQLNFVSQNDNQGKILGINRYPRVQIQRYPSQPCSSSIDAIESQQPRLDLSGVNQSKNVSSSSHPLNEQTIVYNQTSNLASQQSRLHLIDNSQDFSDMMQFFDELLQE